MYVPHTWIILHDTIVWYSSGMYCIAIHDIQNLEMPGMFSDGAKVMVF